MGINIKSDKEIAIMAEGGQKLAEVRDKLEDTVKIGVSAIEIENLANKLIAKTGGEASFKKVPKYYWATCINLNDGIVHGIPKKETVFARGDVVSVDVGLYYKGFHTDTSFSVGLGVGTEVSNFLSAGRQALKNALKEAKERNRIYDISEKMQTVESHGYKVVRQLVGHGVGRELHEAPQIPCFIIGEYEESEIIPKGAVFAIEIMYTMGEPKLILEEDGWTIATADGKISALYEETVAVTKNGPQVLTKA